MTHELSPREAIQALYQQYSNDVYRYARLTLGNHTDAVDTVQEVFFRAFRTYDKFRHSANEKTWLMSIARNYMMDLFRKRKTERAYVEKSQSPQLSYESQGTETRMELERALMKLKPMYRSVFVLRVLQDMTTEETAAALGWSSVKVRTTLYRANLQLRELLGVEPMIQAGDV